MGKTKDKLEALRVVRRCYTANEPLALTKEDCRAMRCPYADSDVDDCLGQAMVDAIDLAEKLYKKNKRLRNGGANGVHD